MKTPAEVIAEGLVSCIISKDPEETQRSLKFLHNKCIQINFPNLKEAIVIYFDKDPENEAGIRYEVYSSPIIRCRKCGWKGTAADLPVQEKEVKIREMSEIVWEQSELMNPILRRVVEICPECGSSRIVKREYRHKGRDLWIFGTHNDIAKLGTLIDPVIPHRVNGLIGAFWSYFVSEKIKFGPFWQFGLVIQFGRLLL